MIKYRAKYHRTVVLQNWQTNSHNTDTECFCLFISFIRNISNICIKMHRKRLILCSYFMEATFKTALASQTNLLIILFKFGANFRLQDKCSFFKKRFFTITFHSFGFCCLLLLRLSLILLMMSHFTCISDCNAFFSVSYFPNEKRIISNS